MSLFLFEIETHTRRTNQKQNQKQKQKQAKPKSKDKNKPRKNKKNVLPQNHIYVVLILNRTPFLLPLVLITTYISFFPFSFCFSSTLFFTRMLPTLALSFLEVSFLKIFQGQESLSSLRLPWNMTNTSAH